MSPSAGGTAGGLIDKMEMDMSDVVYDSTIEGMKKYFRVVEKAENYEFHCLKCKQGWALKRKSNHPGNYLHLLNHAYSHIK